MIFTFYSYKGGVGRTMALANVAEMLYRRGLNILMVDFDLEAPGLERFFNAPETSLNPDEVIQQRGVIDLLLSYKQLSSIPLPNFQTENTSGDSEVDENLIFPVEPISNFIVPLYDRNKDSGSLSIIPSGKRDNGNFRQYAQQAHSFDWNDFYDNWNGRKFFDWFKQEVANSADVVLIDSRTGITEMGGVCTYQLADAVVILVTPNEQNIDGTIKIAQSLSKPVVIVPSRVDNAEVKLLNDFQKLFKEKLANFIPENIKFKQSAFLDLKIPYVPYFSYTEKVAIREFEQDDASGLSTAYKNLVETLAQLAPKDNRLHRKHFGKRQDWGDAPDIPVFFGRAKELETLEKWVLKDKCRLVAIVGMGGIGKTGLTIRLGKGGIGKTDLSLKLAEKIQEEFDYIIWRSLFSAPSLKEILSDLIKFISNQQEVDLPQQEKKQISRLLHYLRKYRCLVILDNAETILQGGEKAGQYLAEYQGYGKLLHKIGELNHNSCLILTSREKPKNISRLAGKAKPVRFLELSGLDSQEGQKIFASISKFNASKEEDWQHLIELYNGNPLALELAARNIQDVFCGNVSQFLAEGKPIFGAPLEDEDENERDDIRKLLDWHFKRLSNREQEIVYWLGINREVISSAELKEDILEPTAKRQLTKTTLESLQRRLPLEKNSKGLVSLQPMLIEYATERLIEGISSEITTGKFELFDRYALIKATAKDYVREIQTRLIAQTILNNLTNPKRQLSTCLQNLQKQSELSGYAAGNILNLLSYLKTDPTVKIDLKNYNFSHLTIRQAYLQNADLQEVNFAYSKFAQCVFTKIFGSVLSVEFSPDGETLATGDTNGEILVWQVKDSRLKLRLKADNNWIRSVAFSPDGKTLASAGENQTIKIWDLSNETCIQTLDEKENQVWSIAFSPDGKILATGGEDETIKIWDIANGKCLKTFRGHNGRVRSIEFSPDGKFIVSGSDDKTIKIWNVDNGKCHQTFSGHNNLVRSVAFSPDGKYIASGSEDKTVKIWDVVSGKYLKNLAGHSSWVWSVAFSPNGNYVASGSADQTVKIWNIASGECQQTLQGHENWVQSVAFNPDGQTLASGSTDRTIKIWEVASAKCQQTLQGHSTWMRTIAFSPDGKTLVSGGEDKIVRLWDVASSQQLKTLDTHSNWIQSVAFSPDGNYVASGSPDRTIKIWDIVIDQDQDIIEEGGNWVRALTFSPDSKTLASGNEDQTVKIWNVASGKCLKTLTGHNGWVSSVAFSPDGKTLISGSTDQTVKVWNVASDECLKTLAEHNDWVNSVAYSPDGKYVASASSDRTIKIWDAVNYQCREIEEHEDRVTSVTFSPNSKTLASGSEDKTIKIFDVASGECVRVLKGHLNWVSSIAFSPDGKNLASTSIDETIKLWNIEAGECIKTLRPPRPYENMNITEVEGLSPVQINTLKALGAKSEL